MKKKIFSLVLLLALLAGMLLPLTSCGDSVTKFYLYNWGEYMPRGEEGSDDVPRLFEEYYEEKYGQKIEVVYSIFSSNEEMYAKLKNGSSRIDLIIPSDYMVQRLIAEDRLQPLDFSNIPNLKNLDERYLAPDYDRGDGTHSVYSVPYTVGLVGLIYNKALVDPADFPEDADGNVSVSWDILWNEKYAGQILTFNNSRDAFGIAQYLLGGRTGKNTQTDNYVNTADHTRWDEALSLLQQQKPLVQAYVMDEVFNKMEGGSAALAPYYAGDYLIMKEENEDLGFAYPKEGTNIFIDALCIPKGADAEHKLIAERFIDFTLETDVEIGGESYNIAKAIAEEICYATPNKAVVEDEEYLYYAGEEDSEILYPELSDYPTYYFHNLPSDTLEYANSLWEKLKIESKIGIGGILFAVAIVLVLSGGGIYHYILRRKRAKYYNV